MAKRLPDDIIPPDRIGSTTPVESHPESTPEPGKFDAYMRESPQAGPSSATSTTPFDLAAAAHMGGTPTQASVLSQMNSTSGVLGDLQTQLKKKDLKLKKSHKYLLRNKLTDAHAYLRTMASAMGIKTGPPPSMLSRKNPIAKFLGLITEGQTHLKEAQLQIQNLDSSGKSLRPGQLLLVQTKLAKAQQEIEYCSVLLSKSLEDIKMLMQVQI